MIRRAFLNITPGDIAGCGLVVLLGLLAGVV